MRISDWSSDVCSSDLLPIATGRSMLKPDATQTRPQVVIVGAGFAGLSATLALRKAPVDITLIDRRNFHLFQPLLYQVATAGLTPSDIAWPVRSILRAQRNARVVLGTVTGVDTDAREVRQIGRAHV